MQLRPRYRVVHLVGVHWGTLFADIKLKVPPHYKLLIIKRNSYVNKSLSSTRRNTLYTVLSSPSLSVSDDGPGKFTHLTRLRVRASYAGRREV